MGAGAAISGGNLNGHPGAAIMIHSQTNVKNIEQSCGVFEAYSALTISEDISFDKPKKSQSAPPLPCFKVELLTASEGMSKLVLKTINIRVSYEYLEFFTDLNNPSVLLRVPFEQIKSWKNTDTTFEFEIIPNSHVRLYSADATITSNVEIPSNPRIREGRLNEAEAPRNSEASNGDDNIKPIRTALSLLPDGQSDMYAGLVIMKCAEAKKLAVESLQAVNRLMIVMQRYGLTKEQISLLSDALIDTTTGVLHAEWRSLLKDIASSKGFSVVQVLDLLELVKRSCPFDYIEFVGYFHGRLLSRTSFDMVIDSLTDRLDRENVLHVIRNVKNKE